MADMRLIDANALNTSVALYMAENAYLNDTPLDILKMVSRWIAEAHTISAVPVVRCWECKHRGSDTCPMCHDEYYYDDDDGADFWTVDNTDDDGFCHMGVKMDGGATDGV